MENTDTTKTNPELVSQAALARILGVSPTTVRRMAQRGAIPCFDVGRKLKRFDLDEVLKVLRRRQEENEAHA